MTSDLCYVLTPKNPKKVNLKYYYAYFNSRRKDIVRRLARGTSKKAINDTRLKSYRISFPKGEKVAQKEKSKRGRWYVYEPSSLFLKGLWVCSLSFKKGGGLPILPLTPPARLPWPAAAACTPPPSGTATRSIEQRKPPHRGRRQQPHPRASRGSESIPSQA